MSRALVLLLFLLAAHSAVALEPGATAPIWKLNSVEGPVVADRPFLISAQVILPDGYYQDSESAFLVFEPRPPFEVLERRSSPPQLRDSKSSFRGSFTLERQIVLPKSFSGSITGLTVDLGWQICEVNGVCLLPATEQRVLPVNVAAAPSDWWPTFWASLGAAFLGGVLLNLMPCVFPVLALKAVGLLSSHGQSLVQRRKEAWAFALGGLGVLTLLGLATALFAVAGQRLLWGFGFQHPAFVWVLTLVFWGFALQLWGVFSWKASPFSLRLDHRPGIASSVSGGALLVLAAAPCTAPLLGPALGYAFGLPPWSIPLFFAAAGLGLVTPLLLLQTFPSWSRWLPKPGQWMVTLERTAGFFMAATVLYLLWIVSEQTGADKIWLGLMLLLVLAAALAAAGRANGSWPWRSMSLFLLVAVLVGSWWMIRVEAPQGQQESPAVELPSGWTAFSKQRLEQAQRSGRWVFVDATAAWCATCQLNDWAVLSRPEVLGLLDSAGVLRLRADDTLPNPEIHQWLESVGRVGLPVYALYRPGEKVIFFPELLNEDNFTAVMARLLAAKTPLDSQRPNPLK